MLKNAKQIRAANCLCGRYIILTLLLLATLFVFGCSTAGPSKKQVADAMQEFVQSDDNPLLSSYEKYDYQLEKSDTSDKEYFASYQLTEKSKLSEVILSLSTEWHKYDQGWEIVEIEVEDAKARPLNGPTKDDLSEAVLTSLPPIYKSASQSIDLLSQNWEVGDDVIQVEVRITSEFSTFSDITENSLELIWDLYDEHWNLSQYISVQEEINFEGINGTWEGEYEQHNVTFQIAGAGTFIYNDDWSGDLTFVLNHNLNDFDIDAKKDGFAIGAYENGFMIDLAHGFELSTRGLLIGTDGMSFEIDGKSIPLQRVSGE